MAGQSLSVKAYVGDNKTLLAFNFANKDDATGLAGFTVECKPPGQPSYYLFNTLQFQSRTHLYAPASVAGVLVSGKPGKTTLPPPFNQVPISPGHEIHDKFIVCGLNGPDPVVYCGSSNLASGGEAATGDNLLEIHDADVATVFAIEALLLVDHYNFLDRYKNAKKVAAKKKSAAEKNKNCYQTQISLFTQLRNRSEYGKGRPQEDRKKTKKPSGAIAKVSATNQPQSKAQAAPPAGVFLHADDAWSLAYFDPNDLHNLERKLFG